MIRPGKRRSTRRAGWTVVGAAGLAGFGSQLATVTAAWVLVEAGASPVLVSVMYACGSAPQLLFGLPAGVLGDRIGYRITVVWSGLVATLVLTALAVTIVVAGPHVPVILGAATLLACADTLRQANLQALSGPSDSPASLAALNRVSRISTLGGALLAGILYSVAGPAWAFTGAALAYAMAALVLRGRAVDLPRAATPHGLRAAAELVGTQPAVRHLFFLVIGVETFLFSPLALLPTFTHKIIDGGSESLGLLTACVSGGGVVALSALRRGPRGGYDRLLLAALVAGPLALLAEGVGADLAVACSVLFILGGALACIDVSSQALMQYLAPADRRGALGGLWVVAVGSAPLGQVGSGLVASALGVRTTIAVFGASALVLGVAIRRISLFADLRSGGTALPDGAASGPGKRGGLGGTGHAAPNARPPSL